MRCKMPSFVKTLGKSIRETAQYNPTFAKKYYKSEYLDIRVGIIYLGINCSKC